MKTTQGALKTSDPIKQIDLTGAIMGRAASYIAKRALMGDYFILVNCKNARTTGTRAEIYNFFLARNNVKTFSNKTHGPFFPHRPDKFMEKIVWGMLPNNARGELAFSHVKCYISDIPKKDQALYATKKITPVKLDIRNTIEKTVCKSSTIEEICTRNGWSERRAGFEKGKIKKPEEVSVTFVSEKVKKIQAEMEAAALGKKTTASKPPKK